MGRKKRNRETDRRTRRRSDDRRERDREERSQQEEVIQNLMAVSDAAIPDAPIPDATIPATKSAGAMGQPIPRSDLRSMGRRGYGPEAQQHILRATEETGTDPYDLPDPVLDVLASGTGQSLDASIQRALEDRMDADFSNVEIHTGSEAAKAADAIDAKAFTCGNAIVFNEGEYDPESADGQHLLAHELAHVKQQTGAAISMMPQADADLEIDPDPQLEREADQAAEEALEGDEPLVINRMGTDVHIQRSVQDSYQTTLHTDTFSFDNPDGVIDVITDDELEGTRGSDTGTPVEKRLSQLESEFQSFKSALSESAEEAGSSVIDATSDGLVYTGAALLSSVATPAAGGALTAIYSLYQNSDWEMGDLIESIKEHSRLSEDGREMMDLGGELRYHGD